MVLSYVLTSEIFLKKKKIGLETLNSWSFKLQIVGDSYFLKLQAPNHWRLQIFGASSSKSLETPNIWSFKLQIIGDSKFLELQAPNHRRLQILKALNFKSLETPNLWMLQIYGASSSKSAWRCSYRPSSFPPRFQWKINVRILLKSQKSGVSVETPGFWSLKL